MTLTSARKLALRAAVNDWIGRNFPDHRSLLAHNQPVYNSEADAWAVDLVTKRNGSPSAALLVVCLSLTRRLSSPPPKPMECSTCWKAPTRNGHPRTSTEWRVRVGSSVLGDGVAAAERLEDASVDLLLTDPPYGISRRYTCEDQIPRRLRRDGSDFIMPRGHFGDWDTSVDPQAWTDAVLPKVRGWAVTFCAQSTNRGIL